MPHGLQHVKHAQHNLDFLQGFYSNPEYRDWVVTVSFYSVVHIVENAIYSAHPLQYRGKALKGNLKHADALHDIAGREKIPRPANLPEHSAHWCRNALVNENFKQIAPDYKELYSQSKTARYISYKFSEEDIDKTILRALLAIIEWSNARFATAFKIAITPKPATPQATPPVPSTPPDDATSEEPPAE